MIHGSGQAFLQNTTEGSAGDVLGLTSYVGGLSGGSWAISTWLANNGAQPDYLVRNVSISPFCAAVYILNFATTTDLSCLLFDHLSARSSPCHLVHAHQIWNISSNLVVPADDKLSFYYNLISEVRDKADKGYQTQITDYWSLALSDHRELVLEVPWLQSCFLLTLVFGIACTLQSSPSLITRTTLPT